MMSAGWLLLHDMYQHMSHLHRSGRWRSGSSGMRSTPSRMSARRPSAWRPSSPPGAPTTPRLASWPGVILMNDLLEEPSYSLARFLIAAEWCFLTKLSAARISTRPGQALAAGTPRCMHPNAICSGRVLNLCTPPMLVQVHRAAAQRQAQGGGVRSGGHAGGSGGSGGCREGRRAAGAHPGGHRRRQPPRRRHLSGMNLQSLDMWGTPTSDPPPRGHQRRQPPQRRHLAG